MSLLVNGSLELMPLQVTRKGAGGLAVLTGLLRLSLTLPALPRYEHGAHSQL